MEIQRCMGCMRKISPGEQTCPVCGYFHGQIQQTESALPTGTRLLNGKYLIGKVLGQGGFGITYLGLDTTLNLKVAVKEFFPSMMAYRPDGDTSVTWHTSVTNKEASRESFLKEARKMAKIYDIPNVVKVREVFPENETAYIVMDFVEGITLKDYVRNNGALNGEDAYKLLKPIMKALEEAHSLGMIHRDISPDNIMINTRGTIMLLDLGAAKELDTNHTMPSLAESSHLIVKRGYSPAEQYIDAKRIGPWSDVYAICATMYWCMTRKVLPDSLTLLYDNNSYEMVFPDTVPPEMIKVLRHGLALREHERIQNMGELMRQLDASVREPQLRPTPQPQPVPEPVPASKPEPAPHPQPAPDPVPASQLQPAPDPVPASKPKPEAKLKFVPVEPTADLMHKPEPEPPVPEPPPDPVAQSEPEPPKPVPEKPLPQPKPLPDTYRPDFHNRNLMILCVSAAVISFLGLGFQIYMGAFVLCCAIAAVILVIQTSIDKKRQKEMTPEQYELYKKGIPLAKWQDVLEVVLSVPYFVFNLYILFITVFIDNSGNLFLDLNVIILFASVLEIPILLIRMFHPKKNRRK